MTRLVVYTVRLALHDLGASRSESEVALRSMKETFNLRRTRRKIISLLAALQVLAAIEMIPQY